jgi:Arc/MetJ family transcription regulator
MPMTVDLHLDDALISKAIEVGHHETAEEAVSAALQEYVRQHGSIPEDAQARRRAKILEWVGQVDYYDDYDPIALRRRKIR